MDNSRQLPGQAENALVRPTEVMYRGHELPRRWWILNPAADWLSIGESSSGTGELSYCSCVWGAWLASWQPYPRLRSIGRIRPWKYKGLTRTS